jgi:hypothetical protein
MASLALILAFLWPPTFPVLLWSILFLGPWADRHGNLRPMLVLAAAFYLPVPLCILASEQSRWNPHFAWDHVARDYFWVSPALPGILMAGPMNAIFHLNLSHPLSQLAIGVTTFLVLSLFTYLARMHTAFLIGLAALAFAYSLVLSVVIPAGWRI